MDKMLYDYIYKTPNGPTREYFLDILYRYRSFKMGYSVGFSNNSQL